MSEVPERLTVDEAYRAAFCFLEAYWQRSGGLDGGSSDVGDILSGMSLTPEGRSMDPASQDEWADAVARAIAAPDAAIGRWQ